MASLSPNRSDASFPGESDSRFLGSNCGLRPRKKFVVRKPAGQRCPTISDYGRSTPGSTASPWSACSTRNGSTSGPPENSAFSFLMISRLGRGKPEIVKHHFEPPAGAITTKEETRKFRQTHHRKNRTESSFLHIKDMNLDLHFDNPTAGKSSPIGRIGRLFPSQSRTQYIQRTRHFIARNEALDRTTPQAERKHFKVQTSFLVVLLKHIERRRFHDAFTKPSDQHRLALPMENPYFPPARVQGNRAALFGRQDGRPIVLRSSEKRSETQPADPVGTTKLETSNSAGAGLAEEQRAEEPYVGVKFRTLKPKKGKRVVVLQKTAKRLFNRTEQRRRLR